MVISPSNEKGLRHSIVNCFECPDYYYYYYYFWGGGGGGGGGRGGGMWNILCSKKCFAVYMKDVSYIEWYSHIAQFFVHSVSGQDN